MQTMNRPTTPRGGSGPLSTRGGTIGVAAIVALVAAAALLVFLNQYRQNLTDSTPQRVLVARGLVPKGTPGAVVASKHLYREVKVRKSQVKDGSISDPSVLEKRIATRDIYPGQPLTTKAFATESSRVLNRISGYQRAISVPVDAAHGMIGKVQAGDHVDVLGTAGQSAGLTGSVVLTRNALLLSVPSQAKRAGLAGANSQNATLRVSDDAAARIAAAADGGKVWLILRPPVGARSHKGLDGRGKDIRARITVDARVRGLR